MPPSNAFKDNVEISPEAEALRTEADASSRHQAAGAGSPMVIDDDALREQCAVRLCPECPERADADEQRLRALAEMDNFKKRLQREKDDQVRYAAEVVLADLLPTLDNLDLALQYGRGNAACKDMLIGVEMTQRLLLDALKRHGLEPVGEAGEPFSPEIHEAIGAEVRPDLPENTVCALMQRGYRLKERLLRPAKVAVSRPE
ncbi:nucleotide exchange factor GrpE [Nitratidesulfovibrio sp. SRB-5]|uniref:nucleotide exchange factor GrpE n=1 Tax=Nitratidesulfovibrio sp. SRB-5 TaxID=2872636 RepID=UPI0010283AEA|nr:nucleotide exchange factor GrpE [Nitratidesulfovibrio sp. SRB-5]MBZ2172605.1 nucleotide exchange factor GrpE [Nitratidesulfovibrio sp. SRB-5]RXF77426.1 nucleotide exchange factor GrpE [Desulfovibrio sp. DS-1]